ncbi:MAG: hypothetical protein Q8830_02790 [Candidatus Phytoplasma australasiaticum]|nr:hypothetical protein [Candidatus Phytoplasma australasiaticum]
MQNLSMDAVRLCVFPLSLIGNAVACLLKLPQSSITSWAELQIAFMERYFLWLKKLKLKDQTNNFEQLPGYSRTMWERFTMSLRNISDHKIVDIALVKIFYQCLDENSQACADSILGDMFLDQPFTRIAERIVQVVKTNRA